MLIGLSSFITVLASTCLFVGDKVFDIKYRSEHYYEFKLNIERAINPLAIGLSIQYFFPKVRKIASIFLKWILAPFAICRFTAQVILFNWDLFLFRLIPINVSLA